MKRYTMNKRKPRTYTIFWDENPLPIVLPIKLIKVLIFAVFYDLRKMLDDWINYRLKSNNKYNVQK